VAKEILGIMGSPRKDGNTELILRKVLREFEKRNRKTEIVQLVNYNIKECTGCRYCLKYQRCYIKDDMPKIISKLLKASVVIIASPVYFNNVTALIKAFMDRTWSIRGKLRGKIGGAIVIGRRYGHELAIAAIHAFMLKHEMIVAHRGVTGLAFERGEILKDKVALRNAENLVNRILELL